MWDEAGRTKERAMMVLRPAVILNVGTLAVYSKLLDKQDLECRILVLKW